MVLEEAKSNDLVKNYKLLTMALYLKAGIVERHRISMPRCELVCVDLRGGGHGGYNGGGWPQTRWVFLFREARKEKARRLV